MTATATGTTATGTTAVDTTVRDASAIDVRSDPGRPPIVIADDTDVRAWVARRRSDLQRTVGERGAVMVRGLAPANPADVEFVVRSIAGESMAEREPFAARRRLGNGVYSSTDWPARQRMCLHNETSYALDLPSLVVFACRVAPTDGGATPIADGCAVLDALPPALVERVAREGWMLRRAFTGDVGSTAAECFGSADRADIAKYCRNNAVRAEWRGDVLTTSQVRPGVVRHSGNDEPIWFNQLAFLSEWGMDPDVRQFLLDIGGPEALPFTTAYGSGEPIDAETVDAIGAAYDACAVREPWQAGDLLIVDNIRTAHGRDPFSGDRDVIVGMGGPVRHEGSENWT